MNIFAKITHYFNWRNIRFISILFAGLFLLGENAFANDGTGAAATNSLEGDIKTMVDILIKLPSILLGFLTYFVSLFLNPGWVNGEIFNLGGVLKDLWIMVSNVVYLIFALLLIVIAFMNIIGKGGDTWELKQALPKFIVGVLMVPFSWFAVQFILSISAILTVSVLSLPFDSFQEHTVGTALSSDISASESENGINTEVIPVECEVFLGGVKLDEEGNAITDTQGNPVKDSNGDLNGNNKDDFFECTKERISVNAFINKIESEGNSIYGLIYIYTYGVMGLDSISNINFDKITKSGGINSISDALSSLSFSIIFLIMYTILMVALFLALLSRGVYLWIYMIFSPALGLLYFFGGSAPGELGEKFSFKELISLAMVPVFVGAALSFGLLFLSIAGKAIEKNIEDSGSGRASNGYELFDRNDKGQIFMKTGPFKMAIEGGESGGMMGAFSTGTDAAGSLIGKLILQMFGLAILWIGVMAALKSSKITGGVIEPIAQFGNSVGELIAKSPTYAPIIPTPNGMTSAAGLAKAGGMVKSHYEQAQTTAGSNLLKGTKFDDGLTQLNTEATNAATRIRELANGSSIDTKGTAREVASLLQKGGDTKTMASSASFHSALKAAAKNFGFSDDKIKAWNLNTQEGIAKAIGELDHFADDIGMPIVPHKKYNGNLTYRDIDAYIKGGATGGSDDSGDKNSNNQKFSDLKNDTHGDFLRGMNNVRYKEAGDNKYVFNIKDGSGDGYESFDINLKTAKDAKVFDNDDKEIFTKIYNQLGGKEVEFKKILEQLKFKSDIHDDLISDVKK